MPYHFFSGSSLDSLIEESEERLVLILFMAEWSGNAYLLQGFLQDIITDFPEVACYQVDADQNEALASQLNVGQLPITFLLNGGEIVDRFTGVIGKEKIKEKLRAVDL